MNDNKQTKKWIISLALEWEQKASVIAVASLEWPQGSLPLRLTPLFRPHLRVSGMLCTADRVLRLCKRHCQTPKVSSSNTLGFLSRSLSWIPHLQKASSNRVKNSNSPTQKAARWETAERTERRPTTHSQAREPPCRQAFRTEGSFTIPVDIIQPLSQRDPARPLKDAWTTEMVRNGWVCGTPCIVCICYTAHGNWLNRQHPPPLWKWDGNTGRWSISATPTWCDIGVRDTGRQATAMITSCGRCISGRDPVRADITASALQGGSCQSIRVQNTFDFFHFHVSTFTFEKKIRWIRFKFELG